MENPVSDLRAIAVVLGVLSAVAPAAGTPLGPPFDSWNVELTPLATNPQVLTLDFDSPRLGFRTRSLVWIPDVYDETSDPLPVVYYLHGTVTFTNFEVLPPPTNPAVGPGTMGLDQTLDEQRFVVVAPDAGVPWCLTCNWIDGVRGQGHLADSHITRELQPLVEALFRVRADRGGRGVMGHSMGGGGALIQGFRHPDRYAFVGSSSGTASIFDDPISVAPIRWFLYNRHQGLLPSQADEIHYRNFNLLDLAPQVIGTGIEIVAVAGDACLDPKTAGTGSCEGFDATDFMNWGQEFYQRYFNNDLVMPQLIEKGVPILYIQREGPHGIQTSTFRRYFLDRANAIFASAVPDPVRFTYKTVDKDFSAWGYDFAVARANNEFLHLLNARLDGRDLVLAGTGTVRLATPAAFEPGRGYRVVRTPAGATGIAELVAADPQGRITIPVELGPLRDLDERKALVEIGRFQFPQTRIEVFDE